MHPIAPAETSLAPRLYFPSSSLIQETVQSRSASSSSLQKIPLLSPSALQRSMLEGPPYVSVTPKVFLETPPTCSPLSLTPLCPSLPLQPVPSFKATNVKPSFSPLSSYSLLPLSLSLFSKSHQHRPSTLPLPPFPLSSYTLPRPLLSGYPHSESMQAIHSPPLSSLPPSTCQYLALFPSASADPPSSHTVLSHRPSTLPLLHSLTPPGRSLSLSLSPWGRRGQLFRLVDVRPFPFLWLHFSPLSLSSSLGSY